MKNWVFEEKPQKIAIWGWPRATARSLREVSKDPVAAMTEALPRFLRCSLLEGNCKVLQGGLQDRQSACPEEAYQDGFLVQARVSH
uniref:Uncharacterized protein n=1 Tax=Cannabis sativa TaxID=3483 RepID=A0A803QSC6_CANSA